MAGKGLSVRNMKGPNEVNLHGLMYLWLPVVYLARFNCICMCPEEHLSI